MTYQGKQMSIIKSDINSAKFWFWEALEGINPVCRIYTSDLFSRYITSKSIMSDKPYTARLSDALSELDTRKRYTKSKMLGDEIVFLLSFFRSALTKKGVSVEYYALIGISMYQEAHLISGSESMKKMSENLEEVVEASHKLASKFGY